MLIAAATGAMGFAAIPTSEPTLAYEMTALSPADDRVVNDRAADDGIAKERVADDSVAKQRVAKDGIDRVLYKEAVATSNKIDQELECMAKVVMHEAANQSRSGQLAVAQLIMNRVGQTHFADSICAVVNQPGQFFQTASYNPRRDGERWATAVEVSRQAMEGDAEQVVPGAVFYHATSHAPNRFFRTRQRISTVGDHIFYR